MVCPAQIRPHCSMAVGQGCTSGSAISVAATSTATMRRVATSAMRAFRLTESHRE